MRIAIFAVLFCAVATTVPHGRAQPAQGQTAKQVPPKALSGQPMHASGTFDVKIAPAEPSPIAKAADTGRMTIDKSWTGGLTGTSKGEMLTGVTKENESMAYVAMERFTGTVNGREGSFLFSHTAEMLNGKPTKFDVQVVPGSGTGALKGIVGTLDISIDAKGHSYSFAYTLPDQQ